MEQSEIVGYRTPHAGFGLLGSSPSRILMINPLTRCHPTMIRSAVHSTAIFVILAMASGGCGQSEPKMSNGSTGKSTASIDPSGLSSISPISSVGSSRTGAEQVAMVLPRDSETADRLWEQGAREESSQSTIVFDSFRATEAIDQAEMIRRAVQSGASSIVVAPGDPEAIIPAIREAREVGIEIVTMLAPITVDGEPTRVVTNPDYLPTAKSLVQAAIEDAEKLEISPDGPALVVFTPEVRDADRRAAALTQALEEAGIPPLDGSPIAFTDEAEDAIALVQELLDSETPMTMVLTADELAFRIVMSVRNDVEYVKRFVTAGYVQTKVMVDVVRSSFASAGAYCDDTVMGRFAINYALQLANGEEVPQRAEVPIQFFRAPNPPRLSSFDIEVGPEGVRPVPSEIEVTPEGVQLPSERNP